jgi:hypothetical protein
MGVKTVYLCKNKIMATIRSRVQRETIIFSMFFRPKKSVTADSEKMNGHL